MERNENCFLCHYWNQGFNVIAAAKKICEKIDEKIVSNYVAQIWFKKFNDNNTNFKDKD